MTFTLYLLDRKQAGVPLMPHACLRYTKAAEGQKLLATCWQQRAQ